MKPSEIRVLQARLKLNQHNFALLLGVSQSTVSRWIRGLKNPDDWQLSWLEKLAANKDLERRKVGTLLVRYGPAHVLSSIL